MEEKETKESLTQRLLDIIQRYCPEVKTGGNPFGGSSGASRFYLWFWLPKRLFRQASCKFMIGPTEVFEEGVWEDIEIRVFDLAYLESIRKVATEYEKMSHKLVTILKEPQDLTD